MRSEVLLACLTLCMVKSGSSSTLDYLSPALFDDMPAVDENSELLIIEGKKGDLTGPPRLWRRNGLTRMRKIDQPSPTSYDSLVSGIRFPAARDATELREWEAADEDRPRWDRALLLRSVLLRALVQSFDQDTSSSVDAPRTSAGTSSGGLEKRRGRPCDLSRISVQMVLEYFRSRRMCGVRVARMRFGLGGRK